MLEIFMEVLKNDSSFSGMRLVEPPAKTGTLRHTSGLGIRLGMNNAMNSILGTQFP